MSKSLKKKVKHKGSSLKKWKGIKNDSDTFWFQNMTTSGQNSPKMANKLNTTAPINFSHLGVNQVINNKGWKDGSMKVQSNLEKTMSFGTATKRSFSNRYYTEAHGGKINSNSIVPKTTKTTKFKKISSNRGSTKPTVISSSSNHRKNNSIKIRKRNHQIRNKNKMQTAPTSPSGRNCADGSTVKIRNNKEIEYKSFIHKEEKKVRKNSINSKRPESRHNKKAKISINKQNSSPGNSKLSSHNTMMSHKRTESNYKVSELSKYNNNLLLTKTMNGTFFEFENSRGKRNNSNLAPSKTQQERYKIYNSGRGSNTGPVKVSVISNNTGDGSWRGLNMFVPDSKTTDMQVNRTYDTRGGSKTGRKKIKVVNNTKKENKTQTKIMYYKKSIPNENNKPLGKENTMVKQPIEVTKEEPENEANTSKENFRKIKKVKIKEPKEYETEDKRDSKILKKLAEVHSFHQPPLPKLEDNAHSSEISMEDIMIGEVIGQGAYAVVKKGLYIPASLTIAIKIYDKSKLEEPQRRKSVKREIKLMEMMDNEYVVKLYGVIETRHQLYILMEYVSGLSLHGYLKLFRNRRLPEDEARRIYQQIMLGLSYCHKKCITHRDIKLENILLDENRNVKIIDFGFSTKIPNKQKVKMFCGTPSYMAPEIVTKQEYSGPPADIWASGVLLFALLCGFFPYKGATDAELYERIWSCESYPPDFLSNEAHDFLNNIFHYDPDDRPSAEEMFQESWMRLPINEKYSTGASTGVGVSKSGTSCQSSEEFYTRNGKPNIFATRTLKKTNNPDDPKEKIKSKLFVLSNSPRRNKGSEEESKKIKIPKNLIAPAKDRKEAEGFKVKDKKGEVVKLGKNKGDRNDEKHYHLHLYHHLWTKGNSKTNETEPSKQASKVSGIGPKARAHTESREGDTETTAEVGAVSGIQELKKNVQTNKYFKDSAEEFPKHKAKNRRNQGHIKYENSKESQDGKHSSSEEDLYNEEVLDILVSLGYPIEEVIRLIEEEDEKMIALYLKILEENQQHMQAIYPSYMRSKASDWKNYAFLLASPENSGSRSRREKSRNNRVLSYSPKRKKAYPNKDKGCMSGSGGNKSIRFAFYPKEGSQAREDAESLTRNRKLLGGRKFSPS